MQNITQNLVVNVGDPSTPSVGSLADTGSPLTHIILASLGLITLGLITWFIIYRRSHRKLNFHGFTILAMMLASASIMSFSLAKVSATPSLSLSTPNKNLTISIPKGGGTDSTNTTITSSTTNPDGYSLKASLTKSEPGIAIKLKGGAVSTPTSLTPNTSPLTLKTTTTATAPSTNDTTSLTLSFTVDGTVKPGKKSLTISYQATDNTPVIPPGPTTMQSMTSTDCTNLPIYDGTNPSAMLSLTDNRDFTTRTYHIAKLADNHCWMLDNLKLGNSEGPITLTPADTNIATNFTLPQVATTGAASADIPGVYGPVPGDTGTNDTNYGYLYNFPAATAGETTTSLPGDGTNGDKAPHSICPKNWRLPTGGDNGEFSNLDITFGGTGQSANSGEPNIAQWQYTGPFRGTFAGFWHEGFVGQSDVGGLWSASAFPGTPVAAHLALFGSDEVIPGVNYYPRAFGLSVRCLLQ